MLWCEAVASVQAHKSHIFFVFISFYFENLHFVLQLQGYT